MIPFDERDKKQKVTFAKTPPKRQREVQCTYKDCKTKFIGYANSKLCEFHKDPKNRDIDKKVVEHELMTFTMNHNYDEKTKIERYCDCCKKPYTLLLYPLMTEYPRFCYEHINAYKRKLYRSRNNNKSERIL